jgi:hypothetical protein
MEVSCFVGTASEVVNDMSATCRMLSSRMLFHMYPRGNPLLILDVVVDINIVYFSLSGYLAQDPRTVSQQHNRYVSSEIGIKPFRLLYSSTRMAERSPRIVVSELMWPLEVSHLFPLQEDPY